MYHQAQNSKKIGNFGEKIAVKYIKSKGYKVINTNMKVGRMEFDIIANISGKIIFIEVKTRLSWGNRIAENGMSDNKIKLLKRAISEYVDLLKIDPENIRLDFIAIDLVKSENKAKIKHYKDIF